MKITNLDLIKKLDNVNEGNVPAFIENIKTVEDSGFKSYIFDLIIKDEKRKKEFNEKKSLK